MSATVSVQTRNGVTTSWLPITSTWPAVRACSTLVYSHSGDGKTFSGTVFDPWYAQHWNTAVTCLPPQVTSWWQQTLATPQNTITSLGPMVCPELYTTASTSQVDASSTFIACCPSNYEHVDFFTTFDLAATRQCFSRMTSGQSISFFVEATPRPTSLFTTTIGTNGGFLYAVPFNGYKIDQVSSSSSAVATTTTAGTAGAASTSSSTASSTPANTSAVVAHDTGLSSGAKIGLGVGVTLGVLGIIALIAAVFLLQRNKKKSQFNPDPVVGQYQDSEGRPVMQSSNDSKSATGHYTGPISIPAKTDNYPAETNSNGNYAPLHQQGVHELGAPAEVHEMAAMPLKPARSRDDKYVMT